MSLGSTDYGYFTISLDAPFSCYTLESDSRISAYFETQEMMEDILILLQFNFRDSELRFRATHIGNQCGLFSVLSYSNQINNDLCIRH
jgi:hypothetical protein